MVDVTDFNVNSSRALWAITFIAVVFRLKDSNAMEHMHRPAMGVICTRRLTNDVYASLFWQSILPHSYFAVQAIDELLGVGDLTLGDILDICEGCLTLSYVSRYFDFVHFTCLSVPVVRFNAARPICFGKHLGIIVGCHKITGGNRIRNECGVPNNKMGKHK